MLGIQDHLPFHPLLAHNKVVSWCFPLNRPNSVALLRLFTPLGVKPSSTGLVWAKAATGMWGLRLGMRGTPPKVSNPIAGVLFGFQKQLSLVYVSRKARQCSSCRLVGLWKRRDSPSFPIGLCKLHSKGLSDPWLIILSPHDLGSNEQANCRPIWNSHVTVGVCQPDGALFAPAKRKTEGPKWLLIVCW